MASDSTYQTRKVDLDEQNSETQPKGLQSSRPPSAPGSDTITTEGKQQDNLPLPPISSSYPRTLPEEPSIVQPYSSYRLQPPAQLEGKLLRGEKTHRSLYFNLYKGFWTESDGKEVSVMIKIPRMAFLDGDTVVSLTPEERFERRILRETSIWHAVRHENTHQFIGFQTVEEATLLVSPVCKNDNLYKYIQANLETTYDDRIELLRGAMRGMAYLHGLEPPIAHGVIAPGNILVTDDLRAVLYEFSQSRVMIPEPTGFTGIFVPGVLGFQAKELQLGDTRVNPMSDVYGMGGTILYTMTGKSPFYKARTEASVALSIVTDKTPDPIDHPQLPESDPLWKLMRRCWDSEPTRRPSAAQIIYKINLIMECGSGFTGPIGTAIVPASTTPQPEPVESVVQPGMSVPSLPPQLSGPITKDKRIGGGGYGEVHRGYWTPPGKAPISVAIKSLKPKENELPQDHDHAVLIRRIRRETVIWKAAEHPNVLKFYGHQMIEGKPILVSAWCENGDLWSFVSARPSLTRIDKLKLLCGAGKGLAHLHSLDPPICHGDIKPQNILVGDNMDALLCDFGISRILTTAGVTEMTTLGEATGTLGFGAKEVLLGLGMIEKSDVYSFGGLILAIMTGKRPFHKKRNPALIIIAINSGERPEPRDYPELSPTDSLWTLMKKCWSPEPSQRPSMREIVAELQKEIDGLSRQG